MGESMTFIGKVDDALTLAREGVLYFQKVGDQYSEVSCMDVLIGVLMAKNEDAEAGRTCEKALAITHLLPDIRWRAHIRQTFVRMHNKRREHTEAVSSGKESLRIYQERDLPEDVVVALNALIGTYLDKGQGSEAVRVGKDTLAFLKNTGDKRMEAAGLYAIATAYCGKGELDQALMTAQDVQKMMKECKNKDGEAQAFGIVAQYHVRLGNIRPAVRAAKKQLELYKKLKNRSKQADALGLLGVIFMAGTKCQDAILNLIAAKELAGSLLHRRDQVSYAAKLVSAYVQAMDAATSTEEKEKILDEGRKAAEEAHFLSENFMDDNLKATVTFWV